MSPRAERRFDVVLFDLLTALLDSWTLWNIVAGSPEDGRKWRAAYLRRTYETGAYRPYETLVAEAAAEVGLSATLVAQLAARYGELEPWPEVHEVLGALRREGMALASSRTAPRNSRRGRSLVPASILMPPSQPSAPVSTSPTHDHTRWLWTSWV